MPSVANAPRDKQPAPPPPPTPAWRPDKDDQADLDALDVALNRMREHIPANPYVMTIPQDVEPRYHHHSEAHAKQWLYSTPFREGEHEAAQYLTHHYYEPGKEIYMLYNSQPIGDSPGSTNSAKQNPRPSTGANTPNTGPKKKISLGAYKKKQSRATGTFEQDSAKASDAASKQAALKGPMEKIKAETQEVLAAIAGEDEEDQKMKKEKSPEQGDLKRKREPAKEVPERKELADSMEPDRSPKRQKLEKSRSPKKVSMQSALRKDGVHAEDHAAGQPTARQKGEDEVGLPPRLSPGMPPRLSPGLPEKLSPLHQTASSNAASLNAEKGTRIEYEDRLPPRLSPTLPENIQKSLQERVPLQSSQASNTSAPNSAVKDKSSMQSPIRKSDRGVAKPKSSTPRNGFRANSSSPAMRSDAEEKPRTSKSITRARSPDLPAEDEVAIGKALKARRMEKDDGEIEPSLIVRFKFKKNMRVQVARILGMKAVPKRDMEVAATTDAESTKATTQPAEKRNGERKEESAKTKGVAQKVGPVKKDKKAIIEEKLPEKTVDRIPDRKSEQRPEKAIAQEKRNLPEDEKSEPAAKRKKLEVSDARKRPSTPAPRDVDPPQTGRSQHVTPSTRKDLLSQAMKREQSQDSNQTQTPPALPNTPTIGSSQTNGVHRPPSSQPSSKTPKQQAWETEQKRLEALGRELKHEASDHISTKPADHKMAAVKSVESFLCYLLAFTCADEASLAAEPKRAPSWQNWRSLTGFYGFVKHHTGPFTSLNGMANSLGVVFCSRIMEISTLVADGPARDLLIDIQSLLQKSAAAAEEKLDIDALQDAFPRSWKDRSKKLPAQEKLEPSKLAGLYKLPLGVATSPVRAARAGYVILQEWMRREGIQYTLRLKL